MNNEAKIENWLNDRVKELGGLSYKFTSPPDNPGVPDRIYIFPNGLVCRIKNRNRPDVKYSKMAKRAYI